MEIKNEIINITKNISKSVIDSVFELIELYIKSTPNKIDDAVLIFLPNAKDFIVSKIEKGNNE